MFKPQNIFIVCLFLLITACSGEVNEGSTEEIAPEEASQVEVFFKNQPAMVNPGKVAITIDFSGSRETSRIGEITLEDFTSLINAISSQGGEIGVIVICSDSNLPALRIKVDPPPYLDPKKFDGVTRPISPNTRSISPFKAAELKQEYQKKLAQYEQFETEVLKTISLHKQDLQQWQDSTDRDIDNFKSELKTLLEQPATCQNSDIWGALARADLFLNEDNSTWTLTPKNFAVLITDGEHNTDRELVPMQSETEILLVNGVGTTIENLDYKAFEAPNAAFGYLTHTLKQQEVANDQ